jgi:hypothetical protein
VVKAQTNRYSFTSESQSVSHNLGSLALARLVGILFITATVATMISQIMMEPLKASDDVTLIAENQREQLVAAVLFEIVNALASAGIAIALFPVLRRCAELSATGYLGLRLVEGAVGVTAAIGLIMLLETDGSLSPFVIAMHDWMFLLVLIVFSVGTFLLYSMLYRFYLVPRVIAVWGLIGGAMLLLSCVSILFGWIEVGGPTDLVFSLPIWINEMALAVWLIFKGFELSHVSNEPV